VRDTYLVSGRPAQVRAAVPRGELLQCDGTIMPLRGPYSELLARSARRVPAIRPPTPREVPAKSLRSRWRRHGTWSRRPRWPPCRTGTSSWEAGPVRAGTPA